MAQSDGADAQRRALESKHARVIAASLKGQRAQVVPRNTAAATLRSGIPDRLRQSSAVLTKALQATLLDGARLGVVHANSDVLHKADATISTTNADPINQDVLAWIEQYGFDLVSGINATTASLLQQVLGDYIDGTITYDDLLTQLEPVFGAARADLVASTEITRSFAEGQRIAWNRTGVITYFRWETSNDESVCVICDELDQQVFAMDDDMPPAHPACRCWTSPAPDGPDS